MPRTPIHGIDSQQVERLLAAREKEDQHVKGLADGQIQQWVGKCPAMRGYNRIMGALVLVGALLAGGGAFGWWSLRNAIQVEVLQGMNVLRGEVTEYVDKSVRHKMARASYSPVPMAEAAEVSK